MPKLSGFGRRTEALANSREVSWRFERPRLRFDFRYGEPAYDEFPLTTWRRLVEERSRRLSSADMGYGDPRGDPELRAALAQYLNRARGVTCTEDEILLVYGSQQAIDLTVRVLVDPGARVGIEEPGYPGLQSALMLAGAECVPIPVDEQGLSIDALRRESGLVLVGVTPSHQFPTGGVMSVERRLQLLEWAAACDATLLEDDYDSEFFFDGPPLECLQGLDHSDCVIYSGTFSKVMFPALRLGYLVVPAALQQVFLAAKVIGDTGCTGIEPRAMADFIREGHFETHLRKARTRTAKRRTALLEAIDEHLPGRGRVTGANAGLHVVLWLDEEPAEAVPSICAAAARRDVGVYSAGSFYLDPPAQACLLLGYGALDEGAIREGIGRLAVCIG